MDMVIGALQQQTNGEGRLDFRQGGFDPHVLLDYFYFYFLLLLLHGACVPMFCKRITRGSITCHKVMSLLSLASEFVQVTIITTNNYVLTTQLKNDLITRRVYHKGARRSYLVKQQNFY